MRRSIMALAVLAVVAGCGEDAAPKEKAVRDPQVAQALDDPLMTDPDLSGGNEAAAALTVESDFSLPVLPVTPEAAAAARAEAAQMVGGIANLAPLPPASERLAPLVGDGPAAHLAVLNTRPGCRSVLRSSAIWAARFPNALPIVPRGAVELAAGSDAAGCRVRIVTYSTPLAPDEVLAFYAARARSGRLSAIRYADGAGAALRGTGDGIVYDARVAAAGEGSSVRLGVALR